MKFFEFFNFFSFIFIDAWGASIQRDPSEMVQNNATEFVSG